MESKKVLLVEDDTMSSQYYKKMLSGRGYTVYPPARSGQEAIEVAKEVSPDLIIMDINIQGEFDGVETAKRILADRKIPIIYASGSSESETIERAKSTATAYLLKPFTKRDLFITIDVAFAKSEMEQKLRKNEARLATILGSIANGVIATNSKEKVEYINDTAEFITGILSENAKGQTLKELLDLRDPQSGSPIKYFYDRIDTLNKVLTIQDASLMNSSGESRRVSLHISPIRTSAQSINGHVCVIFDITDQVEIDTQLNTLGHALESITDGVIILGKEHADDQGPSKIVYANDGFLRSFKTQLDSVLNEPIDCLFGEDTASSFKKNIHLALEENRSFSAEVILYDSERAPVTIDFQISPVRDPQNHVSQQVAILRDITHIRQLEDNMRQSQKIEAVGRLASGIAHDFNNLLSVINSYSDLLMTRFDDTDPIYNQLHQIFSAGRKGSDLVAKLMAFSRKEDSKIQGMDLNVVLSEIEGILARVVREDIELTIEKRIDSAPTRADRTSVEQALINLVVNARDAIAGVGSIRITLDELTASSTSSRVIEKPGHYFRISISDTGSGIDEDNLSQIFDPFFTTKDIGKGTGLGLSLVYGLMQRSEGAVDVESTLGKGTTFHLYFPEVPIDPNETDHDELNGRMTDDELPIADGQKILIVEDDPVFADCISSLLRIHGFDVISASNGQEVIDEYSDVLPEVRLLFSDVVMPKMSGVDLAWEVRKANPEVQILFMTGYDEEVEEKYTLPQGANVLQKPVPLKTVIERVHEALEEQAR
ncbi:MAG: response regulator [Opitutales bacterium]